MAWTHAAGELRISWKGLAGVAARIAADASVGTDRLEGLRRIGIDEKSGAKGNGKLLVIVTDHDTGKGRLDRRALKPTIPETGSHGIPLRDELELSRTI